MLIAGGLLGLAVDGFFISIASDPANVGTTHLGIAIAALVIALPAVAALIAAALQPGRLRVWWAGTATFIFVLFGITVFSIGLFCWPSAALCGLAWRREVQRARADVSGAFSVKVFGRGQT